MNQVKVGDATIRYLDQQSSAKQRLPTLLLVHGFPLDHSMWRYQVEPFASRVRVVCPDLPGFGASTIGARQISMEQMADDLAGLLDQLEIEKVIFCGLSMGGYIGWQFWKHHTHRLAGLIACDTRSSADSDSVARARRVSARLIREQGSASIADELIKKLFFQASRAGSKTEVAMVRAMIAASDPESVAQAQLAMAQRPDATAWLSSIEVPTLFVVGQHDQITPAPEMRSMAASVAGSRFMEISKSGHLPPLENAEDFNLAVLDFLDRFE